MIKIDVADIDHFIRMFEQSNGFSDFQESINKCAPHLSKEWLEWVYILILESRASREKSDVGGKCCSTCSYQLEMFGGTCERCSRYSHYVYKGSKQ